MPASTADVVAISAGLHRYNPHFSASAFAVLMLAVQSKQRRRNGAIVAPKVYCTRSEGEDSQQHHDYYQLTHLAAFLFSRLPTL